MYLIIIVVNYKLLILRSVYMKTEKNIKSVFVKNGEECYGIILFKNYGSWKLSPSDLLSYLRYKFGEEEASKYIFYKKGLIQNLNGYYDILLKRMSIKSVENNHDIHFEYYICREEDYNFKLNLLNRGFDGDDTFKHPTSFINGRYDKCFINFIEEYGTTQKRIMELNKIKTVELKDIKLYGFKVVYVPIDVNYVIEDYDGVEYVKEVSREWS